MLLKHLLSAALRLKVKRLHRRFCARAGRVRETQAQTLLAKLRRNADSAFGREFRLDEIRTVDAFRARLPLATYEHFAPWIDRVRRGDVRALFGPSERLLMFALTSGTWSEPKTIPVTRTFLREYQLGWHVWGGAVFADHPDAYDHQIFRVVSPWNESYTEAGIPCGGISGLMTESLPRIIRGLYLPPLDIARVSDPLDRYALAGRIGVARRVSLVSSANPSSILAVARAVDERRDAIIRDVHDGGVHAAWNVPDDVKRALKRYLKPDPKRAAELEGIVKRTGRLLPRDCWGDLRLMGNWKGGACGVYLDRYPEYFGDVPVRDIGLLASEGRMTIPLRDEGSSGPLDIDSQFFEFIPEREIESDHPVTLLANELETGERYFIVLTTSSGLYRYNIMDLVEVTGFLGETPEVRFLNKGQHFSSLTGEKISEFQVVDSLDAARDAGGPRVEEAVLSPVSGDVPHYALAVEASDGCAPRSWRGFLRRFETRLCKVNVEYRAKRDSGRLGAPVLHLLKPGTFAALREARLAHVGGRREQYKHRFLVGEVDYHRSLPVESTVTFDED